MYTRFKVTISRKHASRDDILLLEKLVADVLGICIEHPSVEQARVCIDKPHALRFADSVSYTLEYNAPDHATHQGPSQ